MSWVSQESHHALSTYMSFVSQDCHHTLTVYICHSCHKTVSHSNSLYLSFLSEDYHIVSIKHLSYPILSSELVTYNTHWPFGQFYLEILARFHFHYVCSACMSRCTGKTE